MRDLGTLGGPSKAVAINERGQIVGTAETKAGDTHAFLWANGKMRPIGPAPRDGQTEVVGINDRGTVLIAVEWYDNPSRVALAWAKGKSQNLGSLGGQVTVPADLNERGQIVGAGETKRGTRQAFLWQHGRMTSLGPLGGIYLIDDFRQIAINERAQIVGLSDTTRGKNHAFLWENGRICDLGNPGGEYLVEPHINNHGQVAVDSGSGPPSAHWPHTRWRSYVWQNDDWARLPTLATTPYVRQLGVDDINDRGQIVGSSITKTDHPHAVLWTWQPTK